MTILQTAEALWGTFLPSSPSTHERPIGSAARGNLGGTVQRSPEAPDLPCYPTALGMSELKWCAISDPEKEKCMAMAAAFREAGLQPSLSCVLGASADHCIRLIEVSPPKPPLDMMGRLSSPQN